MNDRSSPKGAPETPAKASTAESNRAVGRTVAPTPNLVTMRPDYSRAFIAGYSEGFAHGYAAALADVEAADDRVWAAVSRQVRRQSASPRFTQLSDRRGDHERAERAREWERANGLAPIR